MAERLARCGCGSLEATCVGEPVRVSVCHCLDCQRRSGSAFSYNATFPAGQVEARGRSVALTRSSDEGFWARFNFCPECGSTLYYEIERRPGMVTIPVGAFTDPDFPEPTVSVYENRRHRWCTIDTAVPIIKD